MLFKDKYKVWAIIMAVCILAQLVFHVVGPLAINSIQNWIESYEQKQEELKKEQATAPSEPVTDEEQQTTEALGGVLNILCKTAQYIGTIILVFGIFNFMLAFMHEDADRTAKGVMFMVVGGIMIGISVIFPRIFIDSTATSTDETKIATTYQMNDTALD